MDKEKAVNLLLANACCVNSKLACEDCPLSGEDVDNCNELNDTTLYKAVMFLKLNKVGSQ